MLIIFLININQYIKVNKTVWLYKDSPQACNTLFKVNRISRSIVTYIKNPHFIFDCSDIHTWRIISHGWWNINRVSIADSLAKRNHSMLIIKPQPLLNIFCFLTPDDTAWRRQGRFHKHVLACAHLCACPFRFCFVFAMLVLTHTIVTMPH